MRKIERGTDLTSRIIGLSITLHRKLWSDLLKSVYEACLGWEFIHDNLAFQRQMPVPVIYEGVHLNSGCYADMIVDRSVLVETQIR